MESYLDHISSAEWIVRARKAHFEAGALATGCDRSMRQLQRYFSVVFRRSPKSWLNALRMNLSAQLIMRLQTEKEIAADLGFANISHFIREFKRQYGCTPKKYLLIESQRSARRSAWTPEFSLLEAECREALIHPRDEHALLAAHRERFGRLGNQRREAELRRDGSREGSSNKLPEGEEADRRFGPGQYRPC